MPWYRITPDMKFRSDAYETANDAIRAAATRMWEVYPDADPHTCIFKQLGPDWGAVCVADITFCNIVRLDVAEAEQRFRPLN